MPSAMPTDQTIEISVSSPDRKRRCAQPAISPAATPNAAAPSNGGKPAR
jgi:hypothetical protein